MLLQPVNDPMATKPECNVSLQQVIEKVGINSQVLDRECSERDIVRLAEFCVRWRLIGNHLKLEDTDLDVIENDFKGTELQRLQMLKKWKQKFANRATYRVFIEALVVVNRMDQVMKIVEIMKQEGEHQLRIEG